MPCADYADRAERQLRVTLRDRDLGAINSIDTILCVDPEQQGFHRKVPPVPSSTVSLILHIISSFNEHHLFPLQLLFVAYWKLLSLMYFKYLMEWGLFIYKLAQDTF